MPYISWIPFSLAIRRRRAASFITVIAAGVFALASLSGCASGQAGQDLGQAHSQGSFGEDKLTVAGSEPITQFLPGFSQTTSDGYLEDLVFSRLYTNDAQGRPDYGRDALCETCRLSEDGRTYTFTLKQALFSDGASLTASDVQFSAELTANPGYEGPLKGLLQNLEGCDAYAQGKASGISGIGVVDDQTVSFTFHEPGIANFDALGRLHILPRAYYGEGTTPGDLSGLLRKLQAHDYMGSGRYMVSGQSADSVTLIRNPNYFGGAVPIQQLSYQVLPEEALIQAFADGKADALVGLTANTANRLSAVSLPDATVVDYWEDRYGYIGLQMENPVLRDKAVRQALAYGFDRQAFLDAYYGQGNALALAGPFIPPSWAYTDLIAPYPYDPAKANQLLEDAGWVVQSDSGVRGKNDQILSFSFYANENSSYVDALLPMLEENWRRIGVQLTPARVSFETLTDTVFNHQSPSMWAMGWTADRSPTSVYSILGIQYSDYGGNNAGHYHNAIFETLLLDTMRENDPEKQVTALWQAGQILKEDCPYIFIGAAGKMDIYSTKIQNYNASTYQNWTYSVMDWALR